MRSKMFHSSVVSLATAVLLGLSACGGGGGGSGETPTGTTTYGGGAIDGYLQNATVFVDENNDTQQGNTEQSVTTDTNGDFTLTGTITDGTKVYAYGGVDRSTGYPFEGRLSTIFKSGEEVILSPLTTYVTALVDRNVSVADAKALVAQNLGIDPADVSKDPMTQPTLFLAAQKVQKTVEVVAAAKGSSDFNTAYEEVFASLAAVTENNSSGDFNTSALVAQVESDDGITVPAEVGTFLTTYTQTVDAFVAQNVSVNDLDTYGEILNTYTEVVEGALENNDTVTNTLETFDVNATVNAVAENNYTDPLVDALATIENAFDNNISYLGTNTADDNITTNLVLTDTAAAPFDTNDLNLTWSSNNAAIAANGTVTRGDTADIAVQLKATISSSAGIVNNRVYDLVVKRNEYDPVAADKSVTVDEDGSVDVNMSGSFSDQNGDIPTITAISTPSHGTATLTNGAISYTPNANYNGSDTFTYTVTDDTGRTATANVNVTVTPVNDATVWNMVPDTMSVLDQLEDFASFDIELNATDVDGPVSYSLASVDAGIGASISDSTLTVSSVLNANGGQKIIVTATEGGVDTNLSFGFLVAPVDDAPVWQTASSQSALDEDFGVTSLELNATDVEGTITYELVSASANIDANITGSTLNLGSVQDANGAVSIVVNATENGVSTPLDINFTINAVNDAPVADSDDQVLSVKKLNILTGQLSATDVDGDTLTYSNGAVTQGNITLESDGSFSFTAPDVNTTVTLTFDVSDGNLSDSGSQTILVTLSDAPVGVNDTVVVNEDALLNIDVLANDTDDNDAPSALTLVSVTTPLHGLAIKETNGTVTYTPFPDYNGIDSFSYVFEDSDGGQATADVNVTVVAVNDAPEPEDGALSMVVGESFSGVLDVFDADGDTLTYTPTDLDANLTGSTLNPDGSYTLVATSAGVGSVGIDVSDGNATVSFTITVNILEAPEVQTSLYGGTDFITEAAYNALTTVPFFGGKLYSIDEYNGNETEVSYVNFVNTTQEERDNQIFNGAFIKSDDNMSDFTHNVTDFSFGYNAEIRIAKGLYTDGFDSNAEIYRVKVFEETALDSLSNEYNLTLAAGSKEYKAAIKVLQNEFYIDTQALNYADGNATYSSLDALSTTYSVIGFSRTNENRALVFDANNTGNVLEVDLTATYSGGEPFIVDENAGSWVVTNDPQVDNNNSDIIVVMPNNTESFEPTAFAMVDENGTVAGTVYTGSFTPAGTIMVKTFYNESAGVSLVNALNPTTAFDWMMMEDTTPLTEADFNETVGLSLGDFLAPDMYQFEADDNGTDTIIRSLIFGFNYDGLSVIQREYSLGLDTSTEIFLASPDGLAYDQNGQPYDVSEGDFSSGINNILTITLDTTDMYEKKIVAVYEGEEITALTGLAVKDGAKVYKLISHTLDGDEAGAVYYEYIGDQVVNGVIYNNFQNVLPAKIVGKTVYIVDDNGVKLDITFDRSGSLSGNNSLGEAISGTYSFTSDTIVITTPDETETLRYRRSQNGYEVLVSELDGVVYHVYEDAQSRDLDTFTPVP